MNNKQKDIGVNLRNHAEEMFGNLTKSIDDIKTQIELMSKTVDELQEKLNTATSKSNE